MTDEEKKELGKLTKDELISLLGEFREDAEKQRAAEKRAIIEKFFHAPPEKEDDPDENDVFDLASNEAFKKLKKKIG